MNHAPCRTCLTFTHVYLLFEKLSLHDIEGSLNLLEKLTKY